MKLWSGKELFTLVEELQVDIKVPKAQQMPLNEVELGDLYRKALLAMKRARECERNGELEGAWREYITASMSVRFAVEYGLSDFWMEGSRFQTVLDIAHEAQRKRKELGKRWWRGY